MKHKTKVIDGGLAVDDRGTLRFVNDFDFEAIKRFYQVENHSTDIIRAFHGHLKEAKYCYVLSGSIVIYLTKIDSSNKPDKKQKLAKFVLSAKKPQILFIPPKYTHGYKALGKNTKVIFFSTASLKESGSDDLRLPFDYFGKEIWETENR